MVMWTCRHFPSTLTPSTLLIDGQAKFASTVPSSFDSPVHRPSKQRVDTPSRQLSTYTWRVCHWSLDSRSVSMHAGRRCMNDEAMDDGIGIMNRSMYDVSPN